MLSTKLITKVIKQDFIKVSTTQISVPGMCQNLQLALGESNNGDLRLERKSINWTEYDVFAGANVKYDSPARLNTQCQ